MAAGAPPSWPRRLVRRVLLPGALLGLLAIAVGNAYLLGTTARDIVDTAAAAPSRPVAIVLGNSVWRGGVLSWGLAARVRVALELYEAGKIQRLFLSGASRPSEGYDEAGAMADWLEKRGVPRTAMILDRLGRRTAATMANAAAQGLDDALICTQGSHMPRALYYARHAGIRATGVRAPDAVGISFDRARGFVREALARSEAVVEVALRGVTAD